MDQRPLVSVLIPACNAEEFLQEAVDSVLRQDYEHLELVIADDASEDGTRALMEQIAAQDSRVRLIFNEERLGEAATRNRLIEAASKHASFIATMDADDVSELHRIRVQVEFLLEHPAVAVVGAHVRFIDEQSTEIGSRRYSTSPDEVSTRRFIENPFAHPTVMLRTSVLREVGGYDGSRQRLCDYELWMRILARHQGANVDDYLLKYRISTTQAKSKRTRAILRATLALKLLHMSPRAALRPSVHLRLIGEVGLYCLPPNLVLRLFYKRHKLV